MLRTPDSFVSLLTPPDHDAPRNLVYRSDALLVHEADLAFPDRALLGATAAPFLPVGTLDGHYYQCNWVPPDYEPQPGLVFRKLRSLFGSLSDELVAVAGRAYHSSSTLRGRKSMISLETRSKA